MQNILKLKDISKKQKTEIINCVIEYLNKIEGHSGEMIMQDDESQIEAISLAADLADIVSFDFYGFDEE
jgi:hypothetical protein